MGLTSKLVYSNLHGGSRPGMKETFVEVYHVSGFVAGDYDLGDVFLTVGIPQPGAYKQITDQPADRSVYVLDRQARSLDPVAIWEITVTYCEDPANIPAVVNRYATHKPQPVWGYNDADGNPTGDVPRNKVGDPFIPPLMRTRGLTRVEVVCRISKAFRQTLDFGNYVDHKSGSEITIQWTDGDDDLQVLQFSAKTLYLDDIREVTIQEPYTHYQLTMLFLEDRKQALLNSSGNAPGDLLGFQDEIPNAGAQYSTVADTPTGNLRAFSDDVGVSLNGVGLLKLDGTKCGPADTPSSMVFNDIPDADLQGLLDDALGDAQWNPPQGIDLDA